MVYCYLQIIYGNNYWSVPDVKSWLSILKLYVKEHTRMGMDDTEQLYDINIDISKFAKRLNHRPSVHRSDYPLYNIHLWNINNVKTEMEKIGTYYD